MERKIYLSKVDLVLVINQPTSVITNAKQEKNDSFVPSFTIKSH